MLLSLQRILKRYNGIVLLNIAGLSLGLVCVILISVWISHEISYDKFHDDADRIYRVESLLDFTGEPFVWTVAPAPAVKALKHDFAEVDASVNMKKGYRQSIQVNNEIIEAEKLYFAGEEFFKMFSFRLLLGQSETVLARPASIVLSQSMAYKYFGDQDPRGKTITLNNRNLLTVTGVFEDFPGNSHLNIEYLVPMSLLALNGEQLDIWDRFDYITYIRLKENTDADTFNSKLSTYLAEKNEGTKTQLIINPLTRIYLYRDPGLSSVNYPGDSKGPISRVILFGVIGGVILLIAIVNFINLATAYSTQRSKEIGVRKAGGATRRELLYQLFGESFLQTFLAMAAALVIAVLLMPMFGQLSGKQLHISILFTLKSIIIYLAILVITGFIAGLYPAVVLSSFKPVKALRGGRGNMSEGSMLRKILVVIQFVLATVFIFCILVMGRQIRYMQHYDLGFDKERVMVISPQVKYDKARVLADEISRLPGVADVAIGGNVPVNMGNWSTFSEWDGNLSGKSLKFHMMQVDDKYFDLLGFELAEGRELLPGQPRGEVVINEAAVRQMEIDNPLGKTITHAWEKKAYTIVGVVKDFHFRKLKEGINPVFIYKSPKWYSAKLFVKFEPGNMLPMIGEIEDMVRKEVPGKPFTYFFLDEEIHNCYDDEERLGKLINTATVLSIVISAIGLFSLTAFTMRRRQKEIGIRKAHGASVNSLLLLLNSEFWLLLLLASVIALPVAQYVISRWISTYAYHIQIKPFFHLAAVGIVLSVATLTVAGHALRASNLNPSVTLREE